MEQGSSLTELQVSTTAGGYEASFVDDVPEYLLCLLCHLPLRNPVQILTCGHKMCESCFNQLKTFAHAQDTPLLCPVDRDVVDEKQVFADKGLDRVVGNLKVVCGHASDGCQWTGHLRDLSGHEGTCQHRSLDPENSDDVIDDLSKDSVKELFLRLKKCEETIVQRDKDVVDMRMKLDDKLKEVEQLRQNDLLMKTELMQVKNSSRDQLSQILVKMENVVLKNALLEQKVEMLRNDITAERHERSKNAVILEMLQNQLTLKEEEKEEEEEEDQPLVVAEPLYEEPLYEEISPMQLQLLQQQYDKKRQQQEQAQEAQTIPADDVVSYVLHNAKSKPGKSGKSIKEELKKVQDNVQKISNTTRIANLERELKRRTLSSSPTVNEEQLNRKIDLVKEHITNLENIMFCGQRSSPGSTSTDVVLQWKLHNYQHHYNNGEEVYSPVFLTQLKGYRFQLIVDWSGKNKEHLGLHLRLTRGSGPIESSVLEPYNIPFVLQIEDMHGNMTSEKVSLDDIRANRKECFSISVGKKQAARSYGLSEFCSGSDVLRFLVNDMLSIRCVLSPLTDTNYALLN